MSVVCLSQELPRERKNEKRYSQYFIGVASGPLYLKADSQIFRLSDTAPQTIRLSDFQILIEDRFDGCIQWPRVWKADSVKV